MVVLAEDVKGYVVKITGEGVKTEVKSTLEDLKSMPEEAQINEEYKYNSKSGEKSVSVKGVSLAYILKEKAGIIDKNTEVKFDASDGYPIEPHTLEDVLSEDLKYVLVYEVNGEIVDNDDNPNNEEIVIYRKFKEPSEFGTVYKMIVKITVGGDVEVSEKDKTTKQPEEKEIIFTDITDEYKFALTAIEELASKGIINGVKDRIYAPEKEFTRAEFCKIIVEALEYQKIEYTSEFIDIKTDDWFAPYVQVATELKLFKGYTDGAFKPDKPIERQEIASVVGRSAVIAEIVPEEKMDKFTMEK